MKQVTVRLHSTQQVDDAKETMTVTAPGTYRHTPGRSELIYTQHTDEEGDVTTRLTMELQGGQPVITMCRSGAVQNTLTIQRGVRHESPYTMGAYTFTMGITGKVTDLTLTPETVKIKLCYAVDINGTPASVNTIKLTAGN